MSNLDKALQLAERGFYVFPVRHGEDNSKKPLTPRGHLDASTSSEQINLWWGEHPDAEVGVATGASGIAVADVDMKNDKDGWTSLDEAWLEIPETFAYDTSTGGSHLIYKAPSDLNLNGQANYRGMVGVDRRAGSSWVMWVGPVPEREDIAPAPEWLLDEKQERTLHEFEGELREWFDQLTPGEPNVLVRKAVERIQGDMSHSDMVERQHEAIRLGAEGNPGVPELLNTLRDAWLGRPAENHTTPESEWGYKFDEALQRGLELFGGLTDLVKNLPDYSIAVVPTEIPDKLVTGAPSGRSGFSQLLAQLTRVTENNDRIASILWNCPATRDISREWGLEFVYKRVQDARVTPEPVRENPQREEERDRERRGVGDLSLLTDEERDYCFKRPTFVDLYVEAMRSTGWVNEKYARAAGWSVASMAFGLQGYIPVTATDRMGLNLWSIVIGESGTGKTRAIKFRDACLNLMFTGDNGEGVGYDLGTDSSPQGLHMALLERDGKPSMFSADEASGFFSQLSQKEWMSGLSDILSRWYEGHVSPSSKISLKELRGKSASTSFNTQMFATPDRLTEVLHRDLFKTGFLARYNWVIGDPPVETEERFRLFQDEEADGNLGEDPVVIQELVADLRSASAFTAGEAVPLLATSEALARMEEAYRAMYYLGKERENWDIIEPSVTRLMEAMRKVSGICALYRSSSTIVLDDALHAIRTVEEWFHNLFIVADMISAGDFQRQANRIEAWVRARGGKVSKTQVFHAFGNMIERDPRELESRLSFLVESGVINRLEGDRGAVYYELNG